MLPAGQEEAQSESQPRGKHGHGEASQQDLEPVLFPEGLRAQVGEVVVVPGAAVRP